MNTFILEDFYLQSCLESFVENSLRTVWLLLHKESLAVPKDLVKVRYWTGPGRIQQLPAMSKPRAAVHRNYLGDGGKRRQPEPLSRCAGEADSPAQVAVVDVTAAQHVQSTGNGVATPVRDPCKEQHCENKLHQSAAHCPESVTDTCLGNGETWAQEQYRPPSSQVGPCWTSFSHCEFYFVLV